MHVHIYFTQTDYSCFFRLQEAKEKKSGQSCTYVSLQTNGKVSKEARICINKRGKVQWKMGLDTGIRIICLISLSRVETNNNRSSNIVTLFVRSVDSFQSDKKVA